MWTKKFELSGYQPTSFEGDIQSVPLPPDYPMLPLIHSVDILKHEGKRTAEEILRSGQIIPRMCDVFSEELVYTYVGRSAYHELFYPVCFVLKPLEKLLQNLFVFDTGAYSDGHYARLLDNVPDIHAFRIPATADTIRKFILKHFGGNEKYFLSRASGYSKDLDRESPEEFSYDLFCHLSEFYRLGFDERCRTLENIIRGEILLEEALQCVIYPASLCRLADFPRRYPGIPPDAVILDYDDCGGTAAPPECQQAMDRVLRDYYQRNGYFGEPASRQEEA